VTDGEDDTEASADADYNRVFEFYVDQSESDETDLDGLIAYALYKRLKRDWIIQFQKTNRRKPSDGETAAVTQTYMTDEMRNTLRQRAADILTGYADTYVQAAEPHIRERAISDETLRQARAIERSVVGRDALWRQVTAGLIATVIWTGVVVVLAIAAGDLLRDIILGSA
jgi:hypothetical protein